MKNLTSEVLTNHGVVEYGSSEKSFNMMRSFLEYFGFDIDEMAKIPFKTRQSFTLTFESPYNYNSSSVSVDGIGCTVSLSKNAVSSMSDNSFSNRSFTSSKLTVLISSILQAN